MAKPTTDDYVALRQLAERYIDAVNRFDADAWISTWAADGEWNTGQPVQGREQILERWLGAMKRIPNVYMHVYSGVIDDVDGDRASGRWYLGEFLNMPDGSRTMNSICYVDAYSRSGGEWYFQSRKLVALYRGPADLSGQFLKFSDG
jgi:hypothetical protein